MSNLPQNKAFNIGALAGLFLLLLIQVYSYVDLLNTREEISHLSGKVLM